jgi:hypothetical protein
MKKIILAVIFLFQHGKPCPLGKIRDHRLCHMIDSMLPFGGVVPTTTRQRSNNESIHEVITNVMALSVPYCMGT